MRIQDLKEDIRHPYEVLKIVGGGGVTFQVIIAPFGLKIRYQDNPLKGPLFLSMNGTGEFTHETLVEFLAQINTKLAELSDTRAIQRKMLHERLEKITRAKGETLRAQERLAKDFDEVTKKLQELDN